MEERRPKHELADALRIECLKPDLYSSANINGFVFGHKSNTPSCLHVHYLASLKAKSCPHFYSNLLFGQKRDNFTFTKHKFQPVSSYMIRLLSLIKNLTQLIGL